MCFCVCYFFQRRQRTVDQREHLSEQQHMHRTHRNVNENTCILISPKFRSGDFCLWGFFFLISVLFVFFTGLRKTPKSNTTWNGPCRRRVSSAKIRPSRTGIMNEQKRGDTTTTWLTNLNKKQININY